MIYRFKNERSYLNINKDSNSIEYNKKNYNITKIFLLEKLSGKIETEEHILKWSKKELHVYDKLYSISFLEKMDFLETEYLVPGVLQSEIEQEKKFYYSKNLNISIKIQDDLVYIIGPNENQSELVVDIKINSGGKIYTTVKGNKLVYRQNGCLYNSLGIIETNS